MKKHLIIVEETDTGYSAYSLMCRAAARLAKQGKRSSEIFDRLSNSIWEGLRTEGD